MLAIITNSRHAIAAAKVLEFGQGSRPTEGDFMRLGTRRYFFDYYLFHDDDDDGWPRRQPLVFGWVDPRIQATFSSMVYYCVTHREIFHTHLPSLRV